MTSHVSHSENNGFRPNVIIVLIIYYKEAHAIIFESKGPTVLSEIGN